MSTKTSPGRRRGKAAASGGTPVVALLRETLGRAHYERMRVGMLPDLVLPMWEELTSRQREPYRTRFDHAIPALVGVVETLRSKARDDAQLVDQEA